MKISEVSKLTGIPISALRYYEQQGLIRDVERDEQGLRNYTADDLRWVKFLAAVKNARLSLKEIMEYANLYYSKNENFQDRLDLTIKCREKLVKEMDELKEGIYFLDKKIELYKKLLREKKNS